jgi:quercetin dioxygenase-like cupin family protein
MSAASVANIADVQPRFGEWGPGYLVQSDDAAFGVVTLRPGDAFDNHFHEHHTETFLVLEGSAELWLDRDELLVLGPGDLVGCLPRVEHYLRNTGSAPFRALFVKSPGVSGDKVEAPWAPGEE